VEGQEQQTGLKGLIWQTKSMLAFHLRRHIVTCAETAMTSKDRSSRHRACFSVRHTMRKYT
jgi:hypothetical protein